VAPDLIRGKKREFLRGFWATQAFIQDSCTTDEEDAFVGAYAAPWTIQAAFQWFAAFPQDMPDNQELSAVRSF
jgi:hypothetical protein